MKTLVVLSDSHGNKKGVEGLLPVIAENDYALHLGDGVGDFRPVWNTCPDKAFVCSGNCDIFAPYPEEGVLEVERVRVFYCHGHKYGVKRDLHALAQKAKSLDCTLALYGHTHTPLVCEVDGVTLINPGSLRLPIDKGGSYAYIVVHQAKITPTLVGNPLK